MPNVSASASILNPLRRRLACAAVAALLLLPAGAMAQANRRAAGGGGMGGLMGAADLRQALDEIDLTADEKTKVNAILQKAQPEVRDAALAIRDATPEERMDKLKDLQKLMADTKAKVEAELTPAQKTELSKKLAALSVTRTTTMVAAEKTKVDGMDAPADQKKQADDLLDDTTKTLEGYKADADAAKDDVAASAVTDKVQRAFQDLNRQIVAILGQEDGRQVVQAGRQATMRGAGGGGAGGAGGRRRRAAATEPAK